MQACQELHDLLETRRVSITPAAHTTKYERSSCRVGDISGFIESQQVLETLTTKKDYEAMQKMKDQLDQIGQLEQQTATALTEAKQPVELPKLHNCDENTCPHCFEDFLGKEDVLRTKCRHTFHTTCYMQLRKDGKSTCPACDGNLTPTHRWNFIPTTPRHDIKLDSGPAT